MKIDLKPNWKYFVYLATAISALGGLLFGYDVGVISGAILFVKKDFSLSPSMEEIVVSSVLMGSLLGAAAGGILADRLGRRRLLIFTAIVHAWLIYKIPHYSLSICDLFDLNNQPCHVIVRELAARVLL